MTILIVGDQSAAARIQRALSTLHEWSVKFEPSPEAAGTAIRCGDAELAVVGIRGAVAADVNLALELCQRWHAPTAYVLSNDREHAWARLRDTRPLAWISEPFDDVDLRVIVDIAVRNAVEDRRLRDEVQRIRDCAGLMSAESAALARQAALTATLLGAMPPIEAAPAVVEEDDRLSVLTGRERQIVQMVRHGGRVGFIAEELGVRAGTVRNHLSAAFRKFGVRSQEQLIARLRTHFDTPLPTVRMSGCQHIGTGGFDSRQPGVRRVPGPQPLSPEPVTERTNGGRRRS
jgi:DNA-binding NarL/FixJ family response regulator